MKSQPLRLFPRGLWQVGLRYLLIHRWQSLLMILGITIGVAVMVAIDLANASASRAFELSTEAITGTVTHQITGGPSGISEELYTRLRRQGLFANAAPVISEFVSSPQLGNQPMQLLGIDPFTDAAYRQYLNFSKPADATRLIEFLTSPEAVLLTQGTASRYNVSLGQTITIEIQGRARTIILAGLITPSDALAQQTLDGIIVADIATAQELTGRIGMLDRIDLTITNANPNNLGEIRNALPPGLSLKPVEARNGAIEEMTAAFRLNLSALSMLALIVGLFLIYNTMTFAVVQRRSMFGVLRSLGVTRREIFAMVVVEAFLVGAVGSLLGLIMGIILGSGTINLVTQTINDLYYTTSVQAVGIDLGSLLKGFSIGLVAVIMAAAPPAWEAASIPPRSALSRNGLETTAGKVVVGSAAAGSGLILIGLIAFAIPINSIILGFGGTFAVVVGFALLSAIVMTGLLRLSIPLLSRLFGFLGKMAPRSLLNSLSRTAIAVAALMVAVAVTVGVSMMIDSFRYTVTIWLDQTLQGDIYISVPGFNATVATTAVDPSVFEEVKKWPGVSRVDTIRTVSLDSPKGVIQVSGTDNPRFGFERMFAQTNLQPGDIGIAMIKGGVLISEPLANRLGGIKVGGEVVLNTPDGQKAFPIIGIFYDYASSEGSLFMAMDVFRSIWKDEGITALALRLNPGVDPETITRQLQDGLMTDQRLLVRSNQTLKADVMTVFDRTFTITLALRFLATIVAFIGVLSTLMLLQLDKQREIGILRALGLTKAQGWGLTMLETGLMGLVAGVLAIPTGYVLSLILINVINRRSFGWTLQLSVSPEVFLQAIGISLVAALLAGIYPAARLAQRMTAELIRNE